MFHIILISEILLMNQCPFRYAVSAAIITIAAVTVSVIAAVTVSSVSASDRLLYLVNSARTWSYNPLAPFLQSVMDS
jgi:H+/Cl- antiporter ClcA